MPSERENFSNNTLTRTDYSIAGNLLRVFSNAAGQIVFVVDDTVNDAKNNALLVINPVGDRKWDDVLTNDWGVDLETVRPKKDNKYQKLDIEYSGLNVYADLIERFNRGENIDDALAALGRLRDVFVRRAASERLATANRTAENARDTIAQTRETLGGLKSRVRELRSKLSGQRKTIGKEPTKQSASKILRTEAQIDTTTEKIKRAEKRLSNAQKRLLAAEADADAARAILSRTELIAADAAPQMLEIDNSVATDVPAAPIATDIAVTKPVAVPMATKSESISQVETSKPKAEEMADEEVKPLFDKDPEILDEEIAFKPISFTVPDVPMQAQPDEAEEIMVETPDETQEIVVEQTPVAEPEPVTAPVLESLTPVAEQSLPSQIASDSISPAERPAPVEPVITPAETHSGVADNYNNAYGNNNMPEISPVPHAAAATMARPVSPVTGAAVKPVASDNAAGNKPTLIYYIMLIVLIVLSIMTLWLYQKRTATNMPDLVTTTQKTPDAETPAPAPATVAEPEPVQVADNSDENPFLDAEPVVEPEPEPVVVAEPEPQPIVEPEPVVEEPVAEPEPQPEPIVEPEPDAADADDTLVVDADVDENPFVDDAPVTEPVDSEPEPTLAEAIVNTVFEPVVNKPAYNVSQNENMFVADAQYETEDGVIGNGGPVCEDGTLPDINGCCNGEIFTDMEDGNGTLACCNTETGDCYPPLQ